MKGVLDSESIWGLVMWGVGRAYIVPVLEAGGICPPRKLLGTLALIKDGGQKKVKDTRELAKMAHHRRGQI